MAGYFFLLVFCFCFFYLVCFVLLFFVRFFFCLRKVNIDWAYIRKVIQETCCTYYNGFPCFFIRPNQSKQLNKTYFFWLSLQLLLLSALLFVDMNHLSLFRISIRRRTRILPGTLLRNHHSGYICRLLHAMFSIRHGGRYYCHYWLQLNDI